MVETTADLVLHATLPDDAHNGESLLIRGSIPNSGVVWSFPHVQKGRSLDVVLRVSGSRAAQRHIVGEYTFQVTAPDGTLVAEGSTSFTSRYSDVVASARRPSRGKP